jgi:hypothetical protein
MDVAVAHLRTENRKLKQKDAKNSKRRLNQNTEYRRQETGVRSQEYGRPKTEDR